VQVKGQVNPRVRGEHVLHQTLVTPEQLKGNRKLHSASTSGNWTKNLH
jgi:hypothetical protein